MKNILVILVIVIIIVGVFLSLAGSKNMVVVKEGNLKKLPLILELNKYQDSDCGMVIDSLQDVSQVVSPSAKTYFFHDHGGMVNWLKDKSFKEEAILWVKTRDTKKYIDARKAYFSVDDITAMGYGFAAYEVKKPSYIGFKEMSLKMLRGETMNNPQIKKQLLGE